MKTVDKAMMVLGQFTFVRTEIGLSELSRLAQLDKAATHRLLVALSKHGFIEQRADTRNYRLGHGFLRLARIREATVPLIQAAQEVADWVVEKIDETTHISVPMSDSMSTIAHQSPQRGNIINIVPAQPLPFHATAAGFAYLAAASPESLKQALTVKRIGITSSTLTVRSDLLKKIKQVQNEGYAYCHNTFEDGVASIAMPFFLDQVDPAGTISIAVPDVKMTNERRGELLPVLQEAISRIEESLSGFSGS